MTTEEIVKEYKKRFVLIIETKGEELGNKCYKDIENILNTDELCTSIEKDATVKDAPLEVFIAAYLMTLMVAMYGIEKLDGEFLHEKEEYKFIYNNYLKDMTNKFTSQFGLPSVDMDKIGLRIHKLHKE